jgi:hypothetical protein
VPAKSIKDQFSQRMYFYCTQAIANTLTFSAISLSTVLQYAALILHRIEYTFYIGLLGDPTDTIEIALTGSNSLVSLQPNQSQVYDYNSWYREELGANLNNDLLVYKNNVMKDWCNLPGGGMLVPLQDIYLAVNSAGLGAVTQAFAVLEYTVKELKGDEWLELVQRLRVMQ